MMQIEVIFADSIAHAGAGMVASLLDFLSTAVTNPKAKRCQYKQTCLQAIEMILDAEQPQTASPEFAKDSIAYAEQVTAVRDYLRTSGVVKLNIPLLQRLKEGVAHLVTHEKLNTLSNPQKFGVAVTAELIYDILFDFRANAAAGVAASLYQIPAFFVGLWLGNLLKKFINLLLTSADERKLDHTIAQLLKETQIVNLVVNYTPSEQVQQALAERGIRPYLSQLTRAGKSAYQRLQQATATATSAADNVINFSEKREEKAQQERDDRKKRFDELTKGR